MHDHDVAAAQALQHAHQNADQVGMEHPQQLVRRAGGVGERTEDVEQRAHTQFAAHRGGVLHGAMEFRREHEADADGVDALGHLLGREVEVHAQRLQHVGTAAGRRDRAPAVLGDARPGCGSNEGSGGRNVEGVRGVAAGAAGVDQVRVVLRRHLGGEFAHHLRGGGDLADGFLLYPEARDDAGDLHRREFAAHDLAHQRQHLVVEDFALLDQPGERLLRRDHRVPFRKFASMAWPCSVRMDSGWNCTPSTASVLWRTPMISTSSVQAVISRQSGNDSRSITSEW